LKILRGQTLRKMILLRQKNNLIQSLKEGIRTEPYIIINIILAGVIVLIIAYSGIFSPEKDNYPITCIHEKLTGEPCISCGLSHSFSLIVRGRIGEAYQWNMYGVQVFLFFVLQLLMRIAFSFFYLRNIAVRKQLIITDSIGSGIIFLIAFRPYIVKILTDVF
jgi:hypothetical protein